MKSCLADSDLIKKYTIIDSKASPVIGAVLIAYEYLGIKLEKTIIDKIIVSEKKLPFYKIR